jgi:hypothetical protein
VTEVVEEVDGPGIPGPIAGQEVEEDSSGNPGGLGAGEERFHEWGEEIQDFNI